MVSIYENDFPLDGPFPVEFDGWKLKKEHIKLILDLAKDQGRDPYEYIESLLKWMREQGCGPHE
jgi:hypothetical protein